jgi:hypothetical protein
MPPDWIADSMAEHRTELDRRIAQERARATPDAGLLRRLTRERLLAREQAVGPADAPGNAWDSVRPIG